MVSYRIFSVALPHPRPNPIIPPDPAPTSACKTETLHPFNSPSPPSSPPTPANTILLSFYKSDFSGCLIHVESWSICLFGNDFLSEGWISEFLLCSSVRSTCPSGKGLSDRCHALTHCRPPTTVCLVWRGLARGWRLGKGQRALHRVWWGGFSRGNAMGYSPLQPPLPLPLPGFLKVLTQVIRSPGRPRAPQWPGQLPTGLSGGETDFLGWKEKEWHLKATFWRNKDKILLELQLNTPPSLHLRAK